MPMRHMRLEEAVRRSGPTVSSPPTGRPDGPSRPHARPPSPRPRRRRVTDDARGRAPAPPGARQGPRPPHRGRGPVMSGASSTADVGGRDRAGSGASATLRMLYVVDVQARRPEAVDGRRRRAERSTVEVDGRRLSLSNLDKVLYPETGFTKGEVVDYYARIAPVLLPHIADRPMSFQRFPDGVDKQGVLREERPAGHAGLGAHRAAPGARAAAWTGRPSTTSSSTTCRPWSGRPTWPRSSCTCRSGPSARAAASATPDRLVLDLDPGERRRPWWSAPRSPCCCASCVEADGLAAVAKTSGSKGMQVYAAVVPVSDRAYLGVRAGRWPSGWRSRTPDLVVSRMAKDLRRGKVFVDWSQNNAAKTTVAPYSLRARPEPWVSTPLTWDEVEACRTPEDLRFRAEQVLERVDELGDLFAPLLETSAPAALTRRCGQVRPAPDRIFLPWAAAGPDGGPSAGRSACTGRSGAGRRAGVGSRPPRRRGPRVRGQPPGRLRPACRPGCATRRCRKRCGRWPTSRRRARAGRATTSSCCRPRCGPGPRSTSGSRARWPSRR